jgi:hypothetical protein
MFGLNPSTPRQVEQLQKFDDTKFLIRSRKSKGCSQQYFSYIVAVIFIG